jgi:hypothetical protein
MPAHTEVEATETVAGQTVTTALEDDRLRTIPLHDALDHGFENALVRGIVDTIAEGEVDGIVFARADTDVAKFTGAGEVLAVLVEGHCHDAIRGVESFFHTVTMVNIDINVENALLESEQLEDTKNNI